MKLTRYSFEVDQSQKAVVPEMDNTVRVLYKKAVEMPKKGCTNTIWNSFRRLNQFIIVICQGQLIMFKHYLTKKLGTVPNLLPICRGFPTG